MPMEGEDKNSFNNFGPYKNEKPALEWPDIGKDNKN